ncbi:MAG: NAD(P)-dependent glycerol-1-phosphate dehydrogenase [Halobacteriota archaeon]|nr:NAD(P)-dependent glycerol-1-phosphate dehydrogenase [Halobacteriota archaeon]
MKQSKWMQLPRSVVIGHDVLFEVGNVCKELKLSGSAISVSGSTTRHCAGEKICEILNDEGYDVKIVEITSTNEYDVEKVKEAVEEVRAHFMLGVGGGKAIDVAKFVSSEFEIPFLSVPTAASHDGIASFSASITRNSQRVSIPVQAPLGIIADTSIISSAPKRLIASGCGDIISNYTAVKDWELAAKLRNEVYSEYAAALSKMTAKIVLDNSRSIVSGLEEPVRTVVKALVSSGVAMSIAGSSRPGSGSEHKFSHALDKIVEKPALHGEQCGVGAILMMYLHSGDWHIIRDSLRKIGAPTNAKELGIKEEYIIEALIHAHEIKGERYTILGPGLTESAAEKLAVATSVI